MFYFILIFLLICCFFWLCAYFGKAGLVMSVVIFLLLAHAWCCTNLTWYGEKVVAPEISLELSGGFFDSYVAEPLLGEEISLGADGNYYLTLTDHRLSVEQSDDALDVKIKIIPENATLAKAKTTLTITKVARTSQDSNRSWLFSDDEYKNQVTQLEDDFEYTIDGEKLRNNEHSGIEPTKYIITAKNKAGESSKTLIITKYPLYHACALYSEAHPGSSSINDIELCRARSERDAERSNTDNPSTGGTYNSSNSAPDSNHSQTQKTPSSSTTSTCIHYEFGRCWDDIEDEAYSNGLWDKNFGDLGGGYNLPDDCTGVCEDIYEDSYYEGYYDY